MDFCQAGKHGNEADQASSHQSAPHLMQAHTGMSWEDVGRRIVGSRCKESVTLSLLTVLAWPNPGPLQHKPQSNGHWMG